MGVDAFIYGFGFGVGLGLAFGLVYSRCFDALLGWLEFYGF